LGKNCWNLIHIIYNKPCKSNWSWNISKTTGRFYPKCSSIKHFDLTLIATGKNNSKNMVGLHSGEDRVSSNRSGIVQTNIHALSTKFIKTLICAG